MARRNTLSPCSNSWTPCQRRWILPLASPCEARSHPPGISVCATPWEQLYGGSYLLTATFSELPMESTIIWHARDGVWSCEGVMSPNPFSRAAWIGTTILRHLRLAALLWIIVIPLCYLVKSLCNLVITMWILVIPLCLLVVPRRPPLTLEHLRELLSPCLIPRSQGEGGGGWTAARPMRIQRPAQPPQWPRMSAGPIGIRHPRERPSINQRPVTPSRWWVPQCTKAKASTPLIWHSLPFQQSIEIQHSHLAWTAVNFQGFISRPFQTPGRIWIPPLLE